MTDNPSAILIAGPTASGKSALAVALAERLGGSVINADSMQVYRDLRILTARPSRQDEIRVPHLLYGHVSAAEAYSAGRYADDMKQALAHVYAGGRRPIIVGGTGLYFKALLKGLAPVPEIDPGIRARWRQAATNDGSAALHRILEVHDPEMAKRLAANDRQRIVRALEVMESTGRSLAAWQSQSGEPVLNTAETVKLVLAPSRDDLRRRCDARFAAMMQTGAVEEVAGLKTLQLDPALPAMRALGVKPLLRLIDHQIDRDEAVNLGQAETRQYAKRQVTWLKGNMITWNWLLKQEMESQTIESMKFIDN